MNNDMKMKRYLEDSDSSFDSYHSVAPDRVRYYEANYKQFSSRNTDGSRVKKKKFKIPKV